MQNEKEVKELIQSDKKKRVTWNDNQTKGQMRKNFLKLALLQHFIKTNWMRILPN